MFQHKSTHQQSGDALVSITEKCEIAARCLKCIKHIMSEVRCKMDTICHAHTSLGATQSETEHSTGGCFKLL